MREDLLASGAAEAVLSQLDPALAAVPHAPGAAYRLVVANAWGVLLDDVLPGPPPETETVQGDSLHLTKVAAGDWAQTQFQRRSENLWQRNARGVATAAERALARSDAELLVVTGARPEPTGPHWRTRSPGRWTGGRPTTPRRPCRPSPSDAPRARPSTTSPRSAWR